MKSVAYWLVTGLWLVLRFALFVYIAPSVILMVPIAVLKRLRFSLPRGERSDPPRGERDADDGDANENGNR